jgi:anaerobic magnesium-protoporphyrin IX monomethyl ester cyclase
MKSGWSADGTVMVAHSYYLRYDPKQVERMKPYPPLATLLVAAVLRRAGYGVRFFDAMLADGVEAFHRVLEATPPAALVLVEDNFNFLTKMCTTRMREAALDMIRAARACRVPVLVNGSDAHDHPEGYLAAGASAVILGEPEAAVLDVLARWERHPQAELDDVPGLAIARPAGARGALLVHRTAPRPPLADLDTLPFPAWDLVDVERYRTAWLGAHRRFSWNVVASRGCPYRCNWCAKPIFGTRYVQRSPASVAEEVHRLRSAVAPDHLWFADDIFGLTAEWIEAFAAEVEARGAATPFTMQSRVNLMKPRVVEALARAGAEEVWLGVESGSQRILDAMDKGTRLEQIREATRNLRARGIKACWFIQLGYAGEAWDDILKTRDVIRDEQPDDIGVSVSYPLPGTAFYDRVKDLLGSKTNWVHSGDLDMMFPGTYRTEFYRAIRDLLHEEVRQRTALDARWGELARWEPEARRGNGHPLPVA